jgi:hypothetical protein
MGLCVMLYQPCHEEDHVAGHISYRTDRKIELFFNELGSYYGQRKETLKMFRNYFSEYIKPLTIKTVDIKETLINCGVSPKEYGKNVRYMDGGSGESNHYYFYNKDETECVYIHEDDCEFTEFKVDGFLLNIVGFQRKGAIKPFKKKSMQYYPYVFTRKELERHFEEYFDDRFVENILNNFVEGKTFVAYQ